MFAKLVTQEKTVKKVEASLPNQALQCKLIVHEQEKITGQRGTLPAQALGYVKFGKVIFRRPFEAEVCFPDVRIKATSIWRLKNHSKFCL